MSETLQPNDAAMLVFLDSPAPMKLAVAWPRLETKQRSNYEKWAEKAGLDTWQAKKFGVPLRENGICRDDGTTHPVALSYIARTMLGAKGKR